MRRIVVAGLLATAVASVAGASTVLPRTVKCPVGGKSFSYMAFASYSRWGALPDGQPVGSAAFPIPLPQCPDNGLVLFDEFDAATAARLAPIVLGPDYQALRRTETGHYLAWWLQRQLGRSGTEPLWTLLTATWEAKNAGDSARAARYAGAFVAAVDALPADPVSIETVALRARAANAVRELGRFEEAERRRAAIVIDPAAGGAGEEAEANRKGWRGYLDAIAPVIARRDSGRAPLDLIGEREAVFRCLDAGEEGGAALSAFDRDYCARPAIRARADEVRKARAGTLSS